MSLTSQPKKFASKFLTNLGLAIQSSYLVPEEMSALMGGELMISEEDETFNIIEGLDHFIALIPQVEEEVFQA